MSGPESGGPPPSVRDEVMAIGPVGEYRYEYDVLPYVHAVTATMAADRWSAVFYSWLSLKAFMAGIHYVEGTRAYVTQLPDGRVRATFLVIFENQLGLSAWLEYGYRVEEMLAAEGVAPNDIESVLARDI